MTEVAAPAAPPRAKGRRHRSMLMYTAAAFAVVAAGIGWHLAEAPHVAVVNPAAAASAGGRLPDGSFRISPAEARLLKIAAASTRDFQPERVAEGRISYNEDRATPVYPPYTGRVVRVVAQAGQTVRAGDVLFEVETTDLTQAANELLASGDALAKARIQVDLMRRNEARQRDLFTARAAARRDLEQAQADLANALSDQRTAEAAQAAARDRLRVLGRDAQAIAEIERTRRVNAVVPITAPLSGAVVQRRVGPGQWLNAGGAEPVFTIADLSEMWLVAAVREIDAPMVRLGQEVQIWLDALPGRVFPARIEHVAAALDSSTRRLPVRAAVHDPEGVLKPEMFASFRITVGDAASSTSVPASAVIYRGGEAAVWEALDDTRFILRPVRTGLRAGGEVQLLSGLATGARVVVGGALFIDRAATAD
ncbi:efflux RND transporter periplasmic adaptor subunit [Roseomonas sp. SSH11]|uniref:Efflux RND transporter periplasmic adaptor subunit n=1 Tax=Pararoseomonas baculiformis TaxID=2820812 RepID=A0ABS4AIF0_9PROT|nr:efflux RND transporter periplasmic adaptor subunit [Pararoseomonas baculiformis]MBP0446796.1 efflux RND transporter periplasmic adaptor subunit [Pararoseomonas baculiformis]